MIKKTFLILFTILISFSSIYSQTEQQIKNKLKSQGITSPAQIKAELQRRNMTEDDARKLAEKYGISYDQFIASYIIGGTNLNTPPKKTTTIKPAISSPPPNPPKKTVKKPSPPPVSKSGGLTYFGYNLFKNILKSSGRLEINSLIPLSNNLIFKNLECKNCLPISSFCFLNL